MTLPDERFRALSRARLYLYQLAYTPMRDLRKKRISAEVASLLKHYPSDYELKMIAEAAPELLKEKA